MVSALATLRPVFAQPEDLALRGVIGDQLLRDSHPWGELIALQLAPGTTASRKRIRALLDQHVELFAGPIAKVASLVPAKHCLVFEHGFLAEVTLDRRLVPRASWEAAAKAPYWATVHTVKLSVLTTPQWWIAAWANNPAATRSLRVLDVSNALRFERRDDGAWLLVRTTARSVYAGMAKAFLRGATPVFGPKIAAKHRAYFSDALG